MRLLWAILASVVVIPLYALLHLVMAWVEHHV